jgi:hypothetical protein
MPDQTENLFGKRSFGVLIEKVLGWPAIIGNLATREMERQIGI